MITHIINYSFENHKPIDIIYLKDMEITQRTIKVIKIETNHIKAIDINKGVIRTFKKNSILSAMKSSAISPKDLDFRVKKFQHTNSIKC